MTEDEPLPLSVPSSLRPTESERAQGFTTSAPSPDDTPVPLPLPSQGQQRPLADCSLLSERTKQYHSHCCTIGNDLIAGAIEHLAEVLSRIEENIASHIVPAQQTVSECCGRCTGCVSCACDEAAATVAKLHKKILNNLFGVLGQGMQHAGQLGIYPRSQQEITSNEPYSLEEPTATQAAGIPNAITPSGVGSGGIGGGGTAIAGAVAGSEAAGIGLSASGANAIGLATASGEGMGVASAITGALAAQSQTVVIQPQNQQVYLQITLLSDVQLAALLQAVQQMVSDALLASGLSVPNQSESGKPALVPSRIATPVSELREPFQPIGEGLAEYAEPDNLAEGPTQYGS